MSRARDIADLGGSADAGGLTGRNLIINGAQNVAQRGAAGGTATTTASYLSVDRFKSDIDGSGGGDFSHAQVEDAPLGQGFRYASKITTVTQASQPTSESNRHQFYTLLEKQNTFHLDWGTSSAKTCTLSFWVKGSITGTYGFSFAHYGGSGGSTVSYYYYTNYTIDSANTWEKKTITVTGPTVGGNERDGNSFGTRVEWILGIGSDSETGTLNEWTTSSTYRTAANTVYLPENASATLYITGVQFELGEQATPFEHRSYGDELARCQRYCFTQARYGDGSIGSDSAGSTRIHCARYSTSGSFVTYQYPVMMREDPDLTYSASGGATSVDYSNTGHVQLYDSDDNGWYIYNLIAEAEL